MTATSRWRARLSQIDPLVILVSVGGVLVYSLHKFDGGLSRDLGIYSYAGQQVVEGQPPYVGVLNRAGPLAHLIPGAGVAAGRALGFSDLLGMRLLFMLLAAASLGFAYLLARDLFSSWLAGIAAAAALLSFTGYIQYASNGPREKTAMVLFLLVALLALVRRRWFTGGVFVALATLTWQPVFVAGAAAMAVMLFGVPGGERRVAALRFVVGGLVPTALCIGYFAVVGALRDLLDGFLVINARYAESSPFTADVSANWSNLRYGYGASLIVLAVGLVTLVGLTAWSLRRESRHNDPHAYPIAAVGIAGLVGLAWTLRNFNLWPDAFLLLPFAAIGVGGLAGVLSRILSGRWAVAVVATLAVAMTTFAVDYAVTEGKHQLPRQRQAVEALVGALPPDATMLSVEAPQALVLSGQTNATRHQMFHGPLGRFVDDTWPGGLAGYGEWVGREQPTVVAAVPPQARSKWLRTTLSQQYELVGTSSGWQWYAHRSLAPEVISDAKAALRRHRP